MPIDRLVQIMRTLRDPQRGCPWDREQTFATLAPYAIEEAYEVAEAIRRDDLSALRSELGDLLFQVVFHAQLASEQGAFSFEDVVVAICDKMQRRHPHVFGSHTIENAQQQTIAWEEHKRRERIDRGEASVLDDVAIALPGLTRAMKLGRRASGVGFDWPDLQGPLQKLDEELVEIREVVQQGGDQQALRDEVGDLLFSVANLCRHIAVDPEDALRQANAKFERRFRHVETRLKLQNRAPAQATLQEMDELWDEAKQHE